MKNPKIKLSNQNNLFEKIIHISNNKNYKNQRKKKENKI